MDSFKYYSPIFKVNDVIILKDKIHKSDNMLIFEVLKIENNQYELKSFYLSTVHKKLITITLPTMQIDQYCELFKEDIEKYKILYFT